MTSPDAMPETASWSSPESSFRVVYPLALFHEMDFVVNEGFRRIPHGGIEVGGLLFGTIQNGVTRVEAFRPIDSEHAYGPSFKLSERDIAGIRTQISEARKDGELAALSVVGWYISHSRGQLRITEAELGWFNELFPEAGQLTLLLKPEKFKPTQFSFVVRSQPGPLSFDGATESFILPLPGRSAAKVQDAPPAPMPATAPSRSVVEFPERSAERSRPPVEAEFVPVDGQQRPVEPVAPPALPPPTTASLGSDTVVPVPERRERVLRPVLEPERARPIAVPDPVFVPRRRGLAEDVVAERDPAAPLLHREAPRSRAVFFVVLILAGMLGCAIGYWAYTQVPPATLEVRLEPRNGAFIVSWAPQAAHDAESISLRINDGEPSPVSATDAAAGQVVIPARPNGVKVEVIAHHALRDTRGIVRFVNGAGGR